MALEGVKKGIDWVAKASVLGAAGFVAYDQGRNALGSADTGSKVKHAATALGLGYGTFRVGQMLIRAYQGK
jgi:hypothetical protein